MFICAQISFCYSWFRLQLIAIHCNRRRVWTEHPHTRLFLEHFHPCAHITLWLKVSHTRVCMEHVHPHVITCLSVCCFLVLSSSFVSRASTFSLTSTCSTSTPIVSRTPSIKPKAHSQNEEYCPVAKNNPLPSPPPLPTQRGRGSEGERGRDGGGGGETERETERKTSSKTSKRQCGAKQLAPSDSKVIGKEGKMGTHMTLMSNIAIKYGVSAYARVCYVCVQTFFVALAHYA